MGRYVETSKKRYGRAARPGRAEILGTPGDFPPVLPGRAARPGLIAQVICQGCSCCLVGFLLKVATNASLRRTDVQPSQASRRRDCAPARRRQPFASLLPRWSGAEPTSGALMRNPFCMRLLTSGSRADGASSASEGSIRPTASPRFQWDDCVSLAH